MSIIDAKLEMCDATSLAGSAGANALIGDVIDLGARRDFNAAVTADPGEAGDLWLNVKLTTAITGSGTTTLALYHHTAAAVASGAALLTLASAIDKSTAVGTLYRAKLPAGTVNRYIGVTSDIDTAAITAGAVDAWISMDGETPK